ncbi:MAG: hypothetical protein B7Z65_03715 [Ferrovum sp. 21-44-67]|nr:MAG: hypothetical protein B7Z65_03715 [Ferrovum sp. 21-44-67]
MDVKTPYWHCFCQVIDNFGDAGVALRLCRELSLRQEYLVTLFIDDLPLILSLMDEQDRQLFTVRAWSAVDTLEETAPRIVSLFGCSLPLGYIKLIDPNTPIPLWVNIEHLSAEKWIESFHLKPSPHPPLTEFFFYPGFTRGSGGLIHGDNNDSKLLFYYHNPSVLSLLNSLKTLSIPCLLYIPTALRQAEEIRAWQKQYLRHTALKIIWLERMVQSAFDDMMRQCDLLFVRGEDTWARAQLMGKPLLWQIYPQEKNAHWPKLEAFLERYTENIPQPKIKQMIITLHHQWNQGVPITPMECEELVTHWQNLIEHADRWQKELLRQNDLIHQLIQFIENHREI